MLNAALGYAELGYRVFPCVPEEKRPATEHGCLDATVDAEQIERWWGGGQPLNVAISTDGLLVVDVDPQGRQWFDTIDYQSLCGVPTSRTPRGGCHIWFRQDGTEIRNSAGLLATGVDVRGYGGYVLAPPSEVGGKPYRWLQELEAVSLLSAPPQWLVEALGGPRQPLREAATEIIPAGAVLCVYMFRCKK